MSLFGISCYTNSISGMAYRVIDNAKTGKNLLIMALRGPSWGTYVVKGYCFLLSKIVRLGGLEFEDGSAGAPL